MDKIELIGNKFNYLQVLELHSKRICNKKYLCKCDCGNTAIVEGWKIKSGHTKSCGCLHKAVIKEISTTHGYCAGQKKHPLYGVWCNMKNRCYNKNLISYKNYGGRGISVCEEWINDSKKFIEWCLANGWEVGLEIDRIDNDSWYSPENCRFVTASANQYNTRRSKTSVARYCRDNCLDYSLIKSRLRQGWSLDRAATEPKHRRA